MPLLLKPLKFGFLCLVFFLHNPAIALAGDVPVLRPVVINVFPHDRTAFTQGLLYRDGVLYESTGLLGNSRLREIEISSGKVLRETQLSDELFGEGLAAIGDDLVQLTWKNEFAIRYDRSTFQVINHIAYQGEGWGLCRDGELLVMSDGSSLLKLREPNNFTVKHEITVTLNGRAVSRINELECVSDVIYANIWETDYIVRV